MLSRMPSDTGTPVKPPDPARRNERAHDAVLKAAYELRLELGTKHLTIERIAARAGVGKQTIYRWWPSKAAVLLDAWLEVTSVVNPLPDTGDIAADLKSHLGTIIATFHDPKLGPQLRGLVAESQHSEEFAAQVLERLIAPRYALVHERLRSAQQQGQLRDDVDVEIAAEILYGPVYHR